MGSALPLYRPRNRATYSFELGEDVYNDECSLELSPCSTDFCPDHVSGRNAAPLRALQIPNSEREHFLQAPLRPCRLLEFRWRTYMWPAKILCCRCWGGSFTDRVLFGAFEASISTSALPLHGPRCGYANTWSYKLGPTGGPQKPTIADAVTSAVGSLPRPTNLYPDHGFGGEMQLP